MTHEHSQSEMSLEKIQIIQSSIKFLASCVCKKTVNAQPPTHYRRISNFDKSAAPLGCRRSQKGQLTLFHHADVDAAFEPTGLAVAPVVLGDGAASVERTSERGFTLHTAPTGVQNDSSVNSESPRGG